MHKILLLCAAAPIALSTIGCGSAPPATAEAPTAPPSTSTAPAAVAAHQSEAARPRSVRFRAVSGKAGASGESAEEHQQGIEKEQDEEARRQAAASQGAAGQGDEDEARGDAADRQEGGPEGGPEEVKSSRRAARKARFFNLEWQGIARTKNRGQYQYDWDVDQSGKINGSILTSSGEDKGLVVATLEGTLRPDGSYSARVDWDKQIQQQKGTVRLDRRGHMIGQYLDSTDGENFDGGTFDMTSSAREICG